jgi:hypothetical protein
MSLELFRKAVAAREAYWDASRALEVALGLDDVLDTQDEYIQAKIADYAAAGGPEDMEWITETDFEAFKDGLPE